MLYSSKCLEKIARATVLEFEDCLESLAADRGISVEEMYKIERGYDQFYWFLHGIAFGDGYHVNHWLRLNHPDCLRHWETFYPFLSEAIFDWCEDHEITRDN